MILRTLFTLHAIQLADKEHKYSCPSEREYRIKECFFLYHLKHCIKSSIPDVEKYINQYILLNSSEVKIRYWSCQKDNENQYTIISPTTLNIIPTLRLKITYTYGEYNNKVIIFLTVNLKTLQITI